MRNKKRYLLSAPQLSIKSVQVALKSLLYKTSKTERPLGDLLLIDRILTTPEFPSTAYDYQFAMWELLTTTITKIYHHHRQVHQLDIPSADCHIDSVVMVIRQEAQIHSQELWAWSWLYHRYVRYELGINKPQFAEIMRVDKRTSHRHSKHGVRRLTERLIYEERKLRREYRQNWLYTCLPFPISPLLFGRDALLDQMSQLASSTSGKHLQITGSQGIGKTSLVHKFLLQWVDQQKLDDLVWVNASRSIAEIRTTIKSAFLGDSEFTTLAGYFRRYRVAIVIDDADRVYQSALDDLLAELGGALVIVIGREYRNYTYMQRNIQVTELKAEDAKTYIRYLGGKYSRGADYTLTNDEVEQIYTGAGGHPAKIRATLDHWWCAEIDQEATRPLSPIQA